MKPPRLYTGDLIQASDWNTMADSIEELQQQQNATAREQERPTGVAATIAAGVVVACSATRKTTRRRWMTFGLAKS